MKFFTALGVFVLVLAAMAGMTIALNVLSAAFGAWFLIPMFIVCLGLLFGVIWNAVQ